MAENPNVTLPFRQRNLHDGGQPFSQMARLTSSIRTTSRVFKVRMCTFSPRKSGQAKTRPARPLATAMHM